MISKSPKATPDRSRASACATVGPVIRRVAQTAINTCGEYLNTTTQTLRLVSAKIRLKYFSIVPVHQFIITPTPNASAHCEASDRPTTDHAHRPAPPGPRGPVATDFDEQAERTDRGRPREEAAREPAEPIDRRRFDGGAVLDRSPVGPASQAESGSDDENQFRNRRQLHRYRVLAA